MSHSSTTDTVTTGQPIEQWLHYRAQRKKRTTGASRMVVRTLYTNK
jgi:hypothetical protein